MLVLDWGRQHLLRSVLDNRAAAALLLRACMFDEGDLNTSHAAAAVHPHIPEGITAAATRAFLHRQGAYPHHHHSSLVTAVAWLS
jgi:hypothetical protein